MLGKTKLNRARESEVIEFACKCYDTKTKPDEVELILWQYTNACVYYLGGLCPHPKCQWVHDQNLKGLMEVYVAEYEKIEGVKGKHATEAVKMARQWQWSIDELAVEVTGKRCTN